MGTLYKRGKIWWYQHRGERVSTKCRDKIAAESEAKNIERRFADPSYRATEMRLDDALDHFVRAQREHGRSPGTLSMCGYHVGTLTRILGESTRLAQLAPPNGAREVDQFIARRTKEGVKNSTIAKELNTLRGALRLASRLGAYPWQLDAIMPYRFAQQYVPGKRGLTLEQVEALIGVLEPRRAAVVSFIVTTAADWRSVETAEAADRTESAILVRGTKNRRRWRTVPILEPFKSFSPLAVPPFDNWTNVRRDLAAACERAGVPRVSPRDLRRSHGQILRACGIEPHLIAATMGHRDSRMVELVYGTLTPDALSELVNRKLVVNQ